MTYTVNTYRPHWLDGMCCTPGTHDDRHENEVDADRLQRHAEAIDVCARCPVDKDRCLKNGITLRGDGVYAGTLLADGKPVVPVKTGRPKKAA